MLTTKSMLNHILLQTSSDQVPPLSLHLLNIVSMEFCLAEFLYPIPVLFVSDNEFSTKAFQLNLLLSSDRKDRLKLSLVCIEDEDFLKEFVKSRLQFLCTITLGNS